MEYVVGGAIIGGFALLIYATYKLKLKYVEETGNLPPPSGFQIRGGVDSEKKRNLVSFSSEIARRQNGVLSTEGTFNSLNFFYR